MGTRVEQSGEFLACAGRARRCHLEDMADPLHRLPSAAEDLQVIISRRNRALLLQGKFRMTLIDLILGARKSLAERVYQTPG